jgi:hypothetical protein
MTEVTMTSNRGASVTSIVFVDPRVDGKQVLEVSVSEECWDRRQAEAGDLMRPDFNMTMHQVVSSLGQLQSLLGALDSWLFERADVDVELCVIEGQSLRFKMAPDSEWISSREKPVFFGSYATNPSVATCWAYVVDQSCVRIMRDELAEALSMASS